MQPLCKSRLAVVILFLSFVSGVSIPLQATGDSVNSPNIQMNVDTNRASGPGAGNISVVVNTITLAEITLPEFSFGTGKVFTLQVRNGFIFDTTSNITAQSSSFGINNGAINGIASATPLGTANEIITFSLTSGLGSNASTQDIIRINGIKLKIGSAAGAAGPFQTTLLLTTSTIGGSFTNQGIVAANITKGAPDRLVFSNQLGNTQAGTDLLPAVKIVDFGGNIIQNDARDITLSIQTNPGSATLSGTTQRTTSNGVATWVDADDLAINTAADGYVLRASHSGASFLTSDTVDSNSFEITAGDPGKLSVTTQPTDTIANADILLQVTVLDNLDNVVPVDGIEVTLDSAVNPGGWPLLVDSALTKTTSAGVVSWGADDNLRITKAISDYKISVSGIGAPVLTNAFNITVGAPTLVRFLQQPTDTLRGAVMSPAVSLDVTDVLGNQTDQSGTVQLSLVDGNCAGSLSGGSAQFVNNVATFDSLAFDTECAVVLLKADISGTAAGLSVPFSITEEDAVPIAIKSAQIKKDKIVRFGAEGNFNISTDENDDPTKMGAVLTVTGTTGSARYPLSKKGWKKLGSSGFKFKSSKCKSVVVKNNLISANCSGKTGKIKLPEDGPVDFVIDLGRGTARFCGQCGGTSFGNENRIFKRSNCDAPEACP